MSLDFPSAGVALWNLHDACGIRPEYILPVMWHESNFTPGLVNESSQANWGLIQTSTLQLARIGISDPRAMRSWTASYEIARVVTPVYRGLVQILGPLRNAIRVYQAIFLPATLMPKRPEFAVKMDDVITKKPSPFYFGNRGFDTTDKGTITVADVAAVIASALTLWEVRSAIDRAYQVRPFEVATNPLIGTEAAA